MHGPESRVDGGATEERRHLGGHTRQRHDRMRVGGGGVGQSLQPGEGLFCRKVEHGLVRIQHLPIEDGDLIEEALGGGEP